MAQSKQGLRFDEKGQYISTEMLENQRLGRISEQAHRDLAKIRKVFVKWGVVSSRKAIPRLTFVYGIKGGGLYWMTGYPTITLSALRYDRDALVHEMLHWTGMKHKQGFRSDRSKDTLSPQMVKTIFECEARD